jgi:uncharacterized protein
MTEVSAAVEPAPSKAAFALAWLPTVLAAVFLMRAENAVDGALCVVLLAHGPLTLRLPGMQRRRLLFAELPAILLGTFGIAALLVTGMASLLQAPVPWGQAVSFGLYMSIWVLSLRLIYQALNWSLQRCFSKRVLTRALAAVVMIALGMPQLQTRRVAISKQPDVYFAPDVSREVQFLTEDQLTLHGTLLMQPDGDARTPVVIICHGLGSNRANFFAYAQLAWQLDCHVLAFDFRGHGQSDGAVTTIGGREAGDVLAACNWVRAQPELAGSDIVLLGISMGGASVLRAAKEAKAAAVFAESSFADLSALLDERMAGLGPLRSLAAASVRLAAFLQLGVDIDDISPRASLAELSAAVPVVLVHAGDDALIPVAHGHRLAAARAGLQLHVIAGAGHGGCLLVGWTRMKDLLHGLLEQVRRAR